MLHGKDVKMASQVVQKSSLCLENSPLRRSASMESYMVRVHLGSLSLSTEYISVEALKNTRADEIVQVAIQKLRLGNPDLYELAETFSSGGQLCKERRLESVENPVRIQLLWPRLGHLTGEAHRTEYHFFLRKKEADRKVGSWVEYAEPNPIESFLSAFLHQPKHKEYPDLCNLPDLNETTLLRNLSSRFENGHIYTYVGSILISVNPFKFYPIYNPKYVKMYQNRRLGDLPPHIFAIADAAYHTMLQEKRNQCIVISGESGSGKTESTNLLLHHLSALSQRTVHGSGVEQTILGAGPVLEAFGNAKTVHNNNSSRFGKFIQVNYRENGMVHGAVVEKYLLEKSRIVSQAENERNYHVFYYLLAGANNYEKEALSLAHPENYFYLNQSECYTLEGIDGEFVDEAHEFTRLRQSMEMVGFCTELQRRIFCVLAAVLHLGNIEFRRKADHQHHEAVSIKDITTVQIISSLLKVKESTLIEALTKKRTTAGGETVVMNYNMADAVATRDAMAKCLYGGLFDWIVLQVNHALLSKQEIREHQGNSIGVLDIFGFEDFGKNSFEQFCINYANESLHYYFNQHIFKFEQEEYVREGIQWKNIEFIDNTHCLDLFAKKPTGLLFLLDEECNFPGATNDTLLAKFHAQHQNNLYYEVPQMRESAFSIVHYAGKVKYHIQDFREKNSDLIRHDIMLVLKNSSLAFVRELVGYDPVAVLRWAIIRAFFRAYFAFIDAGRRHRRTAGTTAQGAHSWSKFGAILRQQSQSHRAQHLSMPPGDMRNLFQVTLAFSVLKRIHNCRKVIIVERDPNGRRNRRHPSYHGQFDAHLDALNGLEGGEREAVASAEDARNEDDGVIDASMPLRAFRAPRVTAVHESEAWGADGFAYSSDSRVMRRASRVLMKSKSFKPRTRPPKNFRDLKSMKTLAGKTVLGPRSSKGKNKPPSVSAQFNLSLCKLMETLNHANPFFIRCIKSNANKAPCKFDEELVLRQLRYTGMLATVRIRQSGYNYRLTFEEFIQQYKILLPRGLLSSKQDVRDFLEHLDLNTENYQIGKNKLHVKHVVEKHLKDMNYQLAKTKVFLRETEKLLLDDALHQAIMKHIVHIQRWARTRLERQRFIRMRIASVLIQAQVRSFLAHRKLQRLRLQFYATLLIQKAFRGFRERRKLRLQRDAAICIQKQVRGYQARTQLNVVRHYPHYIPRHTVFERKGAVRRVRGMREEREREQQLAQQKEFEALAEAEKSSQFSEVSGNFPLEEWALLPDQKILKMSIDHIHPSHLLQQHQQQQPELFDSHLISNQTEDIRVVSETIDLHSSASDEGILTKESSTEELIDRDLDLHLHAHGHDSEESSGILDDSEPDNISLETPRTKSRGSSFTTPPSTPHSPQPFGHDGVDCRIPPLPIHRLDSSRAALYRTQQGPKDVEIRIRPAIQKSASEESFQSTGESPQGIAIWPEKRISVPLAKQESFGDAVEDDGTLTHRISLTEDRRRELEQIVSAGKDREVPVTSMSLALSGQAGLPTRSGPFNRAKRHIKNIMGERTSLTESTGFEAPREESSLEEEEEGKEELTVVQKQESLSQTQEQTAVLDNSKVSLRVLETSQTTGHVSVKESNTFTSEPEMSRNNSEASSPKQVVAVQDSKMSVFQVQEMEHSGVNSELNTTTQKPKAVFKASSEDLPTSVHVTKSPPASSNSLELKPVSRVSLLDSKTSAKDVLVEVKELNVVPESQVVVSESPKKTFSNLVTKEVNLPMKDRMVLKETAPLSKNATEKAPAGQSETFSVKEGNMIEEKPGSALQQRVKSPQDKESPVPQQRVKLSKEKAQPVTSPQTVKSVQEVTHVGSPRKEKAATSPVKSAQVVSEVGSARKEKAVTSPVKSAQVVSEVGSTRKEKAVTSPVRSAQVVSEVGSSRKEKAVTSPVRSAQVVSEVGSARKEKAVTSPVRSAQVVSEVGSARKEKAATSPVRSAQVVSEVGSARKEKAATSPVRSAQVVSEVGSARKEKTQAVMSPQTVKSVQEVSHVGSPRKEKAVASPFKSTQVVSEIVSARKERTQAVIVPQTVKSVQEVPHVGSPRKEKAVTSLVKSTLVVSEVSSARKERAQAVTSPQTVKSVQEVSHVGSPRKEKAITSLVKSTLVVSEVSSARKERAQAVTSPQTVKSVQEVSHVGSPRKEKSQALTSPQTVKSVQTVSYMGSPRKEKAQALLSKQTVMSPQEVPSSLRKTGKPLQEKPSVGLSKQAVCSQEGNPCVTSPKQTKAPQVLKASSYTVHDKKSKIIVPESNVSQVRDSAPVMQKSTREKTEKKVANVSTPSKVLQKETHISQEGPQKQTQTSQKAQKHLQETKPAERKTVFLETKRQVSLQDPLTKTSEIVAPPRLRRRSLRSQTSINDEPPRSLMQDLMNSSQEDARKHTVQTVADMWKSPALETRTGSAQDLWNMSHEARLASMDRRRSSTPDTHKPDMMRAPQTRYSLKDNDRPEDIVSEAARISAKEAMKAQWLLSHTTEKEETEENRNIIRKESSDSKDKKDQIKATIEKSVEDKDVKKRKLSSSTDKDHNKEVISTKAGQNMQILTKVEVKSPEAATLKSPLGTTKDAKVETKPATRENQKTDRLHPHEDKKSREQKRVEISMRTPAVEKLLDFGPSPDRKAKDKTSRDGPPRLVSRQKKSEDMTSPSLKGEAPTVRVASKVKIAESSSSPKTIRTKKTEGPPSRTALVRGKVSPQDSSQKTITKDIKRDPSVDRSHTAMQDKEKKSEKNTIRAKTVSKSSPKTTKDKVADIKRTPAGVFHKKIEPQKPNTKVEKNDEAKSVSKDARKVGLTNRAPTALVKEPSQDGTKKAEDKSVRSALKEPRPNGASTREVKKSPLKPKLVKDLSKVGDSTKVAVQRGAANVSSPVKQKGMRITRVEQIQTASSSTSRSTTKGEEIKTSKKSSSTTFMRYSKISFKALLEHGSGRKNISKKDSGEESDNSEGDDSPSSPKYGIHMLPGKKTTESAPRKLKDTGRENSSEGLRNKRKHRRKGSKKRREEEKKTEHAWNVSGTSQWQYPTDLLVRGTVELQQLDRFVCSKINELSKDCGRRDTVFDVVFKGALKEFYSNLLTRTSVALQTPLVEFRFRDLMSSFEETLKARALEKQLDKDFPVTIGINAFRGFLDEFNRKKENKELPKIEVKKDKKKKDKDKELFYEHLGHKFQLVQFSIPTYCEFCSSFMWMVEKGNVCLVCKYTVHKKCCNLSMVRCKGVYGDSVFGSQSRVFGAPLESLLDGELKVPEVVERLITAIEINGIYTVGLYRKAGAAGKVKQLINAINTEEDVEFNEYPVHVLTSVMKCFFREMPSPLMTDDLYVGFIRAAEINDEKERIQCLYSIIEKLPTENLDLLERLIFHLAYVAQHEMYNKMSAGSIAIIFAPSILRSPQPLPAQQSLLHVPKQSMCLQSIIQEQVQKIRHTLADIKTLDTATASATDRLDIVRASMRTNGSKADDTESEGALSTTPCEEGEVQRTEEAQLLSEQIRSLQQEKEDLTLRMPALECRHSSSEEDILSTDDLDSTGDELDDGDDNYEEYAVTFDLPAVSPPKNLRHLNKNRAQMPVRRLPSLKKRDSDERGAPGMSSLRRPMLSTPKLKQVGEEIIV